MTVYEIVKKYLKDNGCDGLCTDDCGCHLDDLMPCCEFSLIHCVPGYEISVEEAEKSGQCVRECVDAVIVEKKEAK